jgi:trans-aconitate methyltransferase
MSKSWDASAYDHGHSYVWQKAADLVNLLDPKPGERILDVGCGTGHLTAQIAARGVTVVGMDASGDMIARARAQQSGIEFFVGDVTDFRVDRPFDAVFSNATLHWVTRARDAARCIFAAIRPGGRFVAEFGGNGNVKRVSAAIAEALEAVGGPAFEQVAPWYFPSIAEYSALLEEVGFEVTFATLFDRPTAVEGGIRAWVEMFGTTMINAVPVDRRVDFFARLQKAGNGLERDGQWYADYRRLRIAATRPPA